MDLTYIYICHMRHLGCLNDEGFTVNGFICVILDA